MANMSSANAITAVHIRKLGHTLEEIRCRALENIISKLDHGYGCNCDGVKRELLAKLFNWFTFDTITQPEKVLCLIHKLISVNEVNIRSFGNVRFHNELEQLKVKLGPTWHDKLDEIESAGLKQTLTSSNTTNGTILKDTYQNDTEYSNNQKDEEEAEKNDHKIPTFAILSPDNTIPLDISLPSESGTLVSKKAEGAIRWLVMPWQPLVSSDRGVLFAIEETLNNSTEATTIVRTCQFITNVMLQDFPAEVFLQRPLIVSILQSLLHACIEGSQVDTQNITPTVLRAFYKLTRSLRFRIYFYSDPCIANRRQKDIGTNFDSSCSSPEDRESSEGGLPEANYQAYQSAATSDRSQSVNDNVDESILQLQQMLIPTYCIETFNHVLRLLSVQVDISRPLRNIKTMMDLSSELVQLLTLSVTPTIWLYPDGMSLKTHEDLKSLMVLLGDVLEYLRSYSMMDYCRITYLQLLTITMKLLSSLVPLELAELVLPDTLKMSISIAIMDAPIYLIYSSLNILLQEYVRQFRTSNEVEYIKLYDETRSITKSMKAAILILQTDNEHENINAEIVKTMYVSKSCLLYHRNFGIIKKYIYYLQNINDMNLESADRALVTKFVLYLLANGDEQIRLAMYTECHNLVSAHIGIEFNRGKYTWTSILFLFESNILAEIICHGANSDDEKIRQMAEGILLLILKGKVQMGEDGWSKLINCLLPVFPLLQCLAEMKSPIGQCISKMFDPDIYAGIQLPFLEVLKGNTRLLFVADNAIREEAACRLIYLLGVEKDSAQKLPRLASLHGLPLGSLLVLERQSAFKRNEGNYQRSSLLSVMEMLKMPNVEPKVRKSALVQISVMLSDTSLHKLFLSENGLTIILDIFDKSLIEKDYQNYPDSVIPIITIIKLIVSTQCTLRHELSNRADVFMNILRSVFLFPNNECIKFDASHLLFTLLFTDYMIRTNGTETSPLSISLPQIVVSRMQCPFVCKSHWKISIHRKCDQSINYTNNQLLLTFIRQYWSWEWNKRSEMLWMSWKTLNASGISDKLMIRECEFSSLRHTSIIYYCQQQLFNIQNSATHIEVMCAMDYLWMYVKFNQRLRFIKSLEILTSIPWGEFFERFLMSIPTSTDDCELFVDVLNFFHVYITITQDNQVIQWLSSTMKNMIKSLSDLLRNLDTNNQNVHQSVLRLVRTCSSLEKVHDSTDNSSDMWSEFIELLISNLCSSDQQHFYNLVYLDWLLTCLSHLTSKCQWNCHKDLAIALGNTLMELIISFHGNGAVSFMGLSITRNSIICLNHLLQNMQINMLKSSSWSHFWYDDGKTLSWLPTLWKNRDPLVRASALQLLAGLIKAPHVAEQLLNALVLAPNELCKTLLKFIINQEESCIVKEHACIALSNLIKNSNNSTFQYADSLRSNAIIIYIEQANVYHEISLLCSNIYLLMTLDFNPEEIVQCTASEISKLSSIPKNILHFYDCHDELLMMSVKDPADENTLQFLSTPSLITSVCALLNNLIIVGGRNVVNKLYEHSLDKYFLGCFGSIPLSNGTIKSINQCCDILEMYTSICTVFTNCIIHCGDFASAVKFSPDFLYLLFNYLNEEEEKHGSKLIHLKNSLWSEVFNLLGALSLTENQHFEALRTAIELAGSEMIVKSICKSINNADINLRMSAVACLAFLLTHEKQTNEDIKYESVSLGAVLDSMMINSIGKDITDNKLREVLSSVNKLALKNSDIHITPSHIKEKEIVASDNSQKSSTIGSEICKTLMHLFIAHNYAKSKTSAKGSREKDLIVGALSNLLCVSNEAKKTGVADNLAGTCMLVLKELYTELNLQPYQIHSSNFKRAKKVNPLLNDINRILILLMNFANESQIAKSALVQSGLADMLHKLWAWISLNDLTLVSTLKLLATFTTNHEEGSQSLTLTTVLPGSGPRKSPNTVSLIHVIIHLVSKEIEKAGQSFNNKRLHFAFHVLRNSVHVHECRVSIAKSNLLQFLTKIHPSSTKRAKPWPIIEVYCLEFLIDFTFYEEGQLSVSKAAEGLDVLIQLSRCNTPATRILALSTLRNLVFNVSNRPRILYLVDFTNLLHSTFKSGSVCEVGIAGSMLWSLIANNQKGKLIARTSGLSNSIQEVLGRLTLMKIPDEKQEQELVKMLQYVIRILSTSDVKDNVQD
ncbi:hypothetical protein PV328_008487 [Microctonus aethiopoides]|uniref:Rotatin N-terminal domain-containing protein n=1 Tax=Microctonus aethiopoides TaxID=144406 RepID=A0AA39FJC1_9HYME|nr:hypothetical protein PV328_008487 [Microctonus aethiopoides]